MVAPIKNPAALITTGLLALARVAKSDSVSFVNQDSIDRTVVFTANAGLPSIPNLAVPGGQSVKQNLPANWVGNAYAVPNGGNVGLPGILAEVNFDGWEGNVFFDASAIVNQQPDINSGVKEMFPSSSQSPVSGCQSYSATCDNAYNQPNDLQTKSTTERDITVLLGNEGGNNNVAQVAQPQPQPQPTPSAAPAPAPAPQPTTQAAPPLQPTLHGSPQSGCHAVQEGPNNVLELGPPSSARKARKRASVGLEQAVFPHQFVSTKF
jgi:hypothetical protein